MSRTPNWKRRYETAIALTGFFFLILLITWGWKIYTNGGFTPPAFPSIIAGLSLLDLFFVRQAKNASGQ